MPKDPCDAAAGALPAEAPFAEVEVAPADGEGLEDDAPAGEAPAALCAPADAPLTPAPPALPLAAAAPPEAPAALAPPAAAPPTAAPPAAPLAPAPVPPPVDPPTCVPTGVDVVLEGLGGADCVLVDEGVR